MGERRAPKGVWYPAVLEADLKVAPDRQLGEHPISHFHRNPPVTRVPEGRCEIAPQQVARHHEREQRQGQDAKGPDSGCRAAAIPNSRSPSGKRGSIHHSLRRLVACYAVLRMESPEHSPWRAPRSDLDVSSYQGTVCDFSISQPQEVAFVGEPGEAVRKP
jgi:hypothetical protein